MLKQVLRRIRREAKKRGYLQGEKVFCIGRNKTGTTSLKVALSDLGYKVGDQRKAERLIEHYRDRNFEPIIKYCYTAEAFQDVPFSLPFTYMALDQAFPASKFILSIRDSATQWYNSYLRHQKKVVGTDEVPTPEQLKKHPYVWEGWLYDRKYWDGGEKHVRYAKDLLITQYSMYNRHVKQYFQFKDNLLTLNVKENGAYFQLCDFLDKEPP